MISDTSLAAWYKLQSSLNDRQAAVLAEIRKGPGTAQEITARLGWTINRVSGRITELKKLKLVREAYKRNGAHVIEATSPLPPAFKKVEPKTQSLFS